MNHRPDFRRPRQTAFLYSGSFNYWKANELEEGDNPPIGLLLCSGKDATKVEYATAGLDRQVFVSRYLVALPSPEQLRDLIEADRAALESNGTCATDAPEENT